MKGLRFLWGIILLELGFLFLGINLSWWPNAVWLSFASFWPIILIIIGLRVLLKNNGLFSLLTLIIVTAFLLISLLSPGIDYNGVQISDNGLKTTSSATSQDYNKKVVKSLNLTLKAGAGNISINSLSDNSSYLFTEENTNMGPINKSIAIHNGTAMVGLIKEKMSYFLLNPRAWGNRNLMTKINPNLPTELTINSGASSLNMDLSDIMISQLVVDAGATNGTIDFGNKEDRVFANMNIGASNLTINIPLHSGIKIYPNSGLTKISFNSPATIIKSGNVLMSQNYQLAKNKIVINLTAGASNIKVNLKQ